MRIRRIKGTGERIFVFNSREERQEWWRGIAILAAMIASWVVTLGGLWLAVWLIRRGLGPLG